MMTTIYRGLSLAAVAIIAVTFMAGPAHARGGLKAQTVELLPVDCSNLEGCTANANVSAVTAFDARLGTQDTVWTAIAEDMLPNTVYTLHNRDSSDLECTSSHETVSFPVLETGGISSPMTIGWTTLPVEDTVDICRDGIQILSGEFTGGASGGGKDNNRRNR